jgi:hypothetical protein
MRTAFGRYFLGGGLWRSDAAHELDPRSSACRSATDENKTTWRMSIPAATPRVELALALLRRRAAETAVTLSGDDRVGEPDAARLLELHPDTLARLRKEARGPAAYGLGLGRARVSYRLHDLALWIESRREKFDAKAALPGPTRLKGLIKS